MTRKCILTREELEVLIYNTYVEGQRQGNEERIPSKKARDWIEIISSGIDWL